MGKSSFQASKAARYASTDAGEAEEFRPFSDGMADVSYHTPAWHQARIDALTRPRMSYEEWKLKAKEAEGKLASVADQEAARMREYRALLDADRAARMGKPGVTSDKDKDKDKDKHKKKRKKSSKDKKHKKDSKKKSSKSSKKSSKSKKGSKDKKRKRSDSSSGSSSDDDTSSGSSSDSGSSGSDSEEAARKKKRGSDDPVKLSDFFKS